MQCTSRGVAIKWACGGPRESGALHDVLPDAAALVPVLAPHAACAPVLPQSTFLHILLQRNSQRRQCKPAHLES